MTENSELSYLNPSELVDGPFVITYTAHLPFPAGIPNELGHTLFLSSPFQDQSVAQHFGNRPFVRIRVFDSAEHGLPSWQKGTHAAIEKFYRVRLEGDPDRKYGEDEYTIHNQWVTLETPNAALESENPAADRGFTFHRCLQVFNLFLQSTLLLTGDVNIRTISPHDLFPVVVIGALQKDKEWRILTEMYMAIGPSHAGLLATEKPFSEEELNSGIHAILTNKPYTNTAIWRSRAQRALRQTGDASDAVISFQVAAESISFETYRTLFVDEGYSSTDISALLSKEIPFYTLLTQKIPEKLGGNWDVTRQETPIGQYWKDLYLVRNKIIHTGMHAHGGHAQAAQAAYWALRDYLEGRLWAKHNTYPRTLYARLGKKQLAERGWLSNSMRKIIDNLDKGPQPYYWPHDLRTPQ